VDFSYEVNRSLQACQGGLLVVDATQGIQAQTMSTFFAAFSHDLSIVPVINKVSQKSYVLYLLFFEKLIMFDVCSLD